MFGVQVETHGAPTERYEVKGAVAINISPFQGEEQVFVLHETSLARLVNTPGSKLELKPNY